MHGLSSSSRKLPPLPVVWREARDIVLAHRYRLLLGLVLMIVSSGAALVPARMVQPLVDDVINKGQHERLYPIAFFVGLAAVVRVAAGFTLTQVLGVAAQRAINDMRKQLQAHITRLPVRYFAVTHSGALVSRIMTDPEGLRNLVGNGVVDLVGGIFIAAAALIWLFMIHVTMTLLIVVVLLMFGGVSVIAFRFLRPLFRERREINAAVTGRLTESLSGIRVVKAYTAEAAEDRVFATGADALFEKIRQTITGSSLMGGAGILATGIIGVIIIAVGGRAVISGQIKAGELVSYALLTGMLSGPIMQIASISTQISEAFAGLDRIREIMSMSTESLEDETRQPCPSVRGDIVLQNVTFSYEPGKAVLQDVSLEAPVGTTTALVGSSGGGKSTLVSLIMAFNAPDTGRVLVDGRDLATLKLKDYRSHLGVVLQENFLFDGTIADNIRFSRPEATMEEVHEVGRLAHCEEFVMRFETGYDTIVGERGVKLSGGQRQRIAIARALLAKPGILILDEATSSLDSESEQMIQEGLAALRRGRTTFVIAHRLSTIRSADQILVIEQGRIIERGTHAQLLSLGGRYRQLYDRQYHFEHERFINPGEEMAIESEA
jgi:subfamily B ATP-binding cassette protein MsbA